MYNIALANEVVKRFPHIAMGILGQTFWDIVLRSVLASDVTMSEHLFENELFNRRNQKVRQ